MRLSILSAVLLAVASTTAAAAAAPTEPNPSRVVLPDDVVPDAYRIAFTPHAEAGTFDGHVEIDVTVRRETDHIVLNSADLAIDSAALSGEAVAPTIAVDAAAQTATFAFGHAIAPGHHVLALAYRGRILDQAYGLFRLKYATPAGEATALYTQFENSDARRFVPCWDEPARKAVFELSATVPTDRMAIGNMPVAASEELPGGLKRVRFAPTPRMSSYLLFFGLGDFERVHRQVGGVDVGVVVKRGDTASAAYALDAAAFILPFYDAYFGTPYPLPKLDMIAGAGGSIAFGAMENWGALFYFEHDLLIDPRFATQANRQDVFLTIAHEMAHQWFGDLVTMQWWDDLWLNEGFANWMQAKAADELHPEWHAWRRTLGYKQRTMGTDERRGTHPVITPIADVTQAAGAFDEITYTKGSQVIRTLESWLGPDTFRAGVRRYMAGHAYGNTVSDDLWTAMDAGSTQPVAAVAHGFTLQVGVPLITELGAHCVAGRTVATLSQGEFAIDVQPGQPHAWQVPVTLATLGGTPVRVLVGGPSPQRATVPGCGPLLVNAGQTGYYRVTYLDANLAALEARFAELSADDQLGLLDDVDAAALQGSLPMGTLLALMHRVPLAADPVVVETLVDQLRDLDRLHDGLVTQAAFRAWARALLDPFFAQVGWDASAGEDDNRGRLRAALVEALGMFDDAAVIAQVDRRFAGFLEDPASLPAGVRHAVLQVVALRADAATWDTLHGLARSAPTELERESFYALLASARDPSLAQRALALSLSGEPPATTAANIVRTVAGRHPALALAFIDAHWPAVEALIGDGAGPSIAARFFNDGDETALVARLGLFGEAHVPAAARRSLVKAQAVVAYRATVRQLRLPEGDGWIAAQAAAPIR